ncbi:MAG TPA: type II secretion system F family protein [Patescibacteria group bacterium]|nr:type II secretion system F family protein [Patescibacteria group bacterium]
MQFTYSAKTKAGKPQTGAVEAQNEAAAAKVLQEQGFYVLDLKKEGKGLLKTSGSKMTIPFLGGRVNLKDKIVFTKQLAMMIRSGLPMIDAFSTLQDQTENKYFSRLIREIGEEVRGGRPLSKTLEKYPNIFPKLYISIVSAGEKSGKLDEVLERLADELEKEYELISKIKAAVTYPILIIVALVGIVILMLLFVIPEIKKIFTDMGVELPLITRIVLGASDLLRNFWYIFLILFLGSVFGLRFMAKTEKGGLFWDNFKIRLPLIGKLIRKIYMTRFCRTAGTLVASGLPILEIIDTSKEVLGNRVYRNALGNVGEKVESGRTFSDALKDEKAFPPMIYHLISVGEKSGKLDEILLSMAEFFDREVETTTNNLATLVEPILIIIVGAGVGLVVASVIMPIYSLVNAI